MQSVEEVLAVIGEKVGVAEGEWCDLGAARGRVLAEGVKMGGDSPPFDRAVVDGFAVGSAGGVGATKRYRVLGHVDAGGKGFEGTLGAGECVGINTGGKLPLGVEAVLMVEDARRVMAMGGVGDFVETERVLKAGAGVQRRGADARAGEVVMEAGRRLLAKELAVCATAGAGRVKVRRVRGAVLVTGDELVVPGTGRGLMEGEIWESNGVMLKGLMEEACGQVLDLGICGDEKEKLRGLVERGLSEADLLVVSGGMSMGTRDLVPVVLKEAGVEFFVEKVRIKPGKPFVFGRCERGGRMRYVCGLPGNPVSGYVTFVRFVREVVRRMEGVLDGFRYVDSVLVEGMEANGDREFYVPCVFEVEEGGVRRVRALKWKGSADVFTLGRAEGLIVREAGAGVVGKGGRVRVMWLNG